MRLTRKNAGDVCCLLCKNSIHRCRSCIDPLRSDLVDLGQNGLTIHPDKTRLVPFHRPFGPKSP